MSHLKTQTCKEQSKRNDELLSDLFYLIFAAAKSISKYIIFNTVNILKVDLYNINSFF